MNRPKYRKERELYRATYYKGAVVFNDHDTITNLQRCERFADGKVESVTCSASGRVELADGRALEYVDIRVYVAPHTKASST